MKNIENMNKEEIISKLRDMHFNGESMTPDVLSRAADWEFTLSGSVDNDKLKELQRRLSKLLKKK
ncbi:MAG: hypothetical protein PF549_01160 [Patescibacteria group bacterium]|jgi:hypothetical protein|nr:hypothetical protein [Patescibacteria group bacterium]